MSVSTDQPTAVLPKLISADELAQAIGVNRWRIYELVRQGQLPHVRLGLTVKFDPTKIAAWLHAGGTRSDSGTEVEV